MGDQMEQEKLESGNMVVPLSLMANEESIAEEKSCRDVTVVSYYAPIGYGKCGTVSPFDFFMNSSL